MRDKLLQFLFTLVRKNYLAIIIFLLFLGVVFFAAFKTIKLESNYIALLPQEAPSVKTMNELSEKLRGVGQFSIVIHSKSRDRARMEEVADSIYSRLSKLNEIQYIQYKVPVSFFQKYFYLMLETEDLEEIYYRLEEKISYELWSRVPVFIDLEEDEEEAVVFDIDDIIAKYVDIKFDKEASAGLERNPEGYMFSQDGEILVMFVKPDFMTTDTEKTEQLLEEVEQIVAELGIDGKESDIEISYAGSYKLSYDQKNSINRDIGLTSLIALALIFLAILLFVQNVRLSLFLLASLGVGVLSVYGLAYVTLGHINLITGFLIAILTGLGVNYGIHFLLRYKENLAEHNHSHPLKSAFINTGRASITGAATTAISLFTLIFSKFLGFSEFGLLSSFGIIMTLAVIYIGVSSLVQFNNNHLSRGRGLRFWTNRAHRRNSAEESRLRRAILSISASLLVLTVAAAFFSLGNIRFEYNSKKLEVKGQESIRTTELIQDKFNISTDPAIYYTYNREEEVDFYRAVRRLMQREGSSIGSVASISNMLPLEEEQLEKIEWVKKINRELNSFDVELMENEEEREQIRFIREHTANPVLLKEEEIPPSMKRRFVATHDGKKLYVTQIFPNKVLFDAREMESYVAEIKEIKGELKNYHPTGMHILYVFLIKTVLREGRLFIMLVFVIIWILLLFDFKNIKDSLIAMIPLIFGLLWLIEIMGIFGIKFNFMNIIVLPIILGTGVDNGVHLYHRYRSCNNILVAVKRTGAANFVMSFTVALGWISLFFARYEGLKTMAFVGAVGIMMTFLASITIMPAILLLFPGKKDESYYPGD